MRSALFAAVIVLSGCVAVEETPRAAGEWTRTNADVHVGLARSALERRQWVRAEENAREALRVDAQRLDAALLLTRALLGRHAFDEAEEAARRAVGLDEADATAHLLLGECSLALERPLEAREAYAAAAARGSAAAARVLGALPLRDGEDDAAALPLREADAIDGGVEGRSLLAAHLRERGRIDEARLVLEEAAAGRAADGELRLQLDQLRFEAEDASEIVERVRGAERNGRPSPLEERLLAAAGLLRRGDGAEAARAYRGLARQLPDEPRVRLALGEALLLEHDAAGAEAAFLAATRLDPESRAAWVGVARARRGTPGAAVDPLERAVALDPSHAPTRSLLVMALLEEGNLGRAREEAAELRILDPGGRLDRACRRLLERRAGPSAERSPSAP
ncbi:MAG: tetratricopeptide repeat protein [Planctomycetota bacterium JB042]